MATRQTVVKKHGRTRWILLVLILVILLGGAGLATAFFSRSKPVPPEKIAKVEQGDIARSVVAVGKIEPLSKIEVKSKANGIIQALRVDAGDSVKEGDILAELDKENLQAQVREARATLDGEEANLKAAVAIEARARIEAANPDLEFTRRDYERVQALFAQKIASPQQLDDMARAYEAAKNRQKLLEASVQTAQAQIDQAKARVAAAKASLDRAEENLNYATIRAPFSGVVLTRNTEVGDAVSSILNLGSAATLIMTLGDVSSVYIKGQVDEADVGKIQTNYPVRTKVESYPNESFQGLVKRIAPMGKELNNVTTFEVRVSISNPQGKLRVNMTANAEIVLEERKQAVLIPEAAVAYDKDRNASVQRLDGSSKTGSRKVPITLGISNGQKAEVKGGLAAGDQVVLP